MVHLQWHGILLVSWHTEVSAAFLYSDGEQEAQLFSSGQFEHQRSCTTGSLIFEVINWEELRKNGMKKESYFREAPDCPQIRKINHKQKQKMKLNIEQLI